MVGDDVVDPPFCKKGCSEWVIQIHPFLFVYACSAYHTRRLFVGIACRNFYFAPQITDDLSGIIIENENFVLIVVSPRNISVNAFIVSAFSGQFVHDFLVW